MSNSILCGNTPNNISPSASHAAIEFSNVGGVPSVLSQSNDSATVEPGVSIACFQGIGLHEEMSYWRSYHLPSEGVYSSIEVRGVRFGVELACSSLWSGQSQPAELRLHVQPAPGIPDPSQLTLLHSEPIVIKNGTELIVDQALSEAVQVPAGQTLVVELWLPDRVAAQDEFFVGANTLGETAPGYFSAPDPGCAAAMPVDISSVVPSTINIILDVLYTDDTNVRPGVGNINELPLFVDAAGGDYRLRGNSPCIDAGTAAPTVGLPATDFEGAPRLLGCRPDMGADEAPPKPQPGSCEDFILETVVNGLPSRLTRGVMPNDFISIRYASPGGTFDGKIPLLLGELFVPDSPPTGASPILLPELHISLGGAILFNGGAAGPFSPLVGPSVIPPGGAGVHFQMPTVVPSGAAIRLQALALDGGTGAAANGIFASTAAPDIVFDPVVMVEALGSNSFNNDTSSGFFQVTNRGPAEIRRVTFDFLASPNVAHAGTAFYLNQGAMADRFDGGNSTMPGCQGTYRNGSAIATGLRFDGQNRVSTCDPSADTGFQSAHETFSGATVWARTVTFRFDHFEPGEVFEVDIDTDDLSTSPGPIQAGAHMAGMVVIVEWDDGHIARGVLVGDPQDANRSSLEISR